MVLDITTLLVLFVLTLSSLLMCVCNIHIDVSSRVCMCVGDVYPAPYSTLYALESTEHWV